MSIRVSILCWVLGSLAIGDAIVGQEPSTIQNSKTDDSSLQAMLLTPKATRAAVARIRPALVTIESFGGVSTQQGKIGGIRKQGEGNTTGILVSKEGHVITSTFSFISRPPTISVVTSDGERRVAKLLGEDRIRKLSMLKIEGFQAEQLPQLVSESELRVGQWAISVGVGYGDVNPAVSMGIISAKNRIGGRAIQTDANISPANYGGPLIDIAGRVIGICVPMNPQSQATGAGVEWYDSGIGFAIPLADAEDLLNELKQGRSIYPGFLGVRVQTFRNGQGAWIEHVAQRSPADKAGLLREDVIVAINEIEIRDTMQLMSELSKFRAEQTINLEIRVAGTDDRKTVEVKLSAPPKPSGLESPLQKPTNR